MRVDGKISAGYAIVCDCGEAFALKRIGVAIECPACGRTELGADIAVDYYLTRGGDGISSEPATNDLALPGTAAG